MGIDKRDHVHYLTVSKSYSGDCTCSLTEQNTTNVKQNSDKIELKKFICFKNVIILSIYVS